METLITILVLMAVSALSTWVQKKQHQRRSGSDPRQPGRQTVIRTRRTITTRTPTSAPAEPPPQSGWDWQRELRRILEDEAGGTASGPTPAPEPPPLIVRPQQQQQEPAPPPRIRPQVVRAPAPMVVVASPDTDTSALDSKKDTATPELVAQEAERVLQQAQADMDVRARELQSKTPRDRDYIREKAARLRIAVAERAQKMTRDAEKMVLEGAPLQVHRVEAVAVMNSALGTLKDPAAARAAFISALVFGPSKATQIENVF